MYFHLMLYISTTRNLGCNYGAPLRRIFGAELSECRCDVGLSVRSFHLRSSKTDVSTFEDRRSMCRPSKIDDRCVDLRTWMIDVPTFEDRWSLCRPSKTDDRCEIMLLHLPQNIDGSYIVVCELCRGFALQCFHLCTSNNFHV